MLVIMQALRAISQLNPPQLPGIDLPAVPDIAAVSPLAKISGADPSNVLNAVGLLERDREVIFSTIAQGKSTIGAAIGDLIAMGLELATRALPVAVGLLIPNPVAQAAARTMLQAMAAEALARATARIASLIGELAQVAAPLAEVAGRAILSTVAGGKHALDELESTALNALPAGLGAKIGAGAGTTPSIGAGVGADANSGGSFEATPAALTSRDGDDSPDGLSSLSSTAGRPTGASGSSQGAAAVDAALSRLGTPYVWGGTGAGGFDCSGFTQWAWRQAGVELPRLAEDQAIGRQVTADELQKGDLVVWDGHVAMYAGDGQIVEAGDPVQTNPLRTSNMGMTFKGFWRPTG